MTVEYKGFKIGDRVKFTENAVKPDIHVGASEGTVIKFGKGCVYDFYVQAAGDCEWYSIDEIELLPTVEADQPALLDEFTVRTISEALSEVYTNKCFTDGEIVAAVATYLRGLQDAMGIRNHV